MGDNVFVIAFVVILIILGISASSGQNFMNLASSTPATTSGGGTTISSGSSGASTPTQRLSDNEIEQRTATLFRELDNLREDLREAKLREPISKYANMVDLRSGNARSTDPEEEYLTLQANSGNDEAINISDWYVESYVTEERAAIPQGARILPQRRSREKADIYLLPGDQAYLISDENPFTVSFHENACTGYLDELGDVNPFLNRSCPRPIDEMIRFENIALDNDKCYDFVEDIRTCQILDEDIVSNSDISGACKRFIDDVLTYEGCVEKHGDDPFFDDVGYWRIYLDQEEDLWREEREIIRLIDGDDKIVDVIEY